MNNAEVHGKRAGIIHLRLFIKDGVVCFEITNQPGPNHSRCLQLQTQHGHNFLLRKHDQLIASSARIGSENSTFLGMREVSTAAALLDAEVDVNFEELAVVTTILLAAQLLEDPKATKQSTETPEVSCSDSLESTEPAAANTSIAAPESLDYSNIMFICCDDDRCDRPPITLYCWLMVVAGHLVLWQQGC